MVHPQMLRKRLKRFGIALLILSPFLLLVWVHVSGYLKVQAQVRAIRDAGDPATLEDLEALAQKIPIQEDAAAFYEKVFACLAFDDMETALRVQLPSTWRIESGKQAWPLPPEDRQWVRDVLDADDEALALLKNAPEIQGRVFDRLCADWPDAFVPRMESLHRVVDLLELQAISAVDQQDAAALVESIGAGLSVADTLREAPFGFPLGYRRGLIARTARTLGWASRIVRFSEDQQRDLDQQLDAITWPMSLRDRLVSERCAFLAVYQNPTPDILREFGFSKSISNSKRIPIDSGWIAAFKWLGLLRHSEALFLVQSGQIIEASLAWKPGQGKDIGDLIPELDRPWPVTLTRMFASYADAECQAPLAVQATLGVLRCALAARQFHQRTGQWPRILDGLVPDYLNAIPLDPFTGTPIRIRFRQGGRAVFSVGEDLQASQSRYFKDDFDRRTSDDIIIWLEPPDEHPDKAVY